MNPYAPPGDPAELGGGPRVGKAGAYQARLDGAVLIASRGAAFPTVCLKCGSHQTVERRAVKLQWTPMWARMSIVFCALPGLIAMAMTTKRAELAIPLCAACNARWTAARNALIASVIVLVVSLVALRLGDEPFLLLPLVAVAVVGMIVVSLAFVKPRMLRARKIDAQFIELEGCHPNAAQEIAEGSS